LVSQNEKENMETSTAIFSPETTSSYNLNHLWFFRFSFQGICAGKHATSFR